MRNTLILTIFLFFNTSISIAQTFKSTYLLTLQSDSTNVSSKQQERAFLFIENNQNSYYATENFLKKDSVLRLVKSGKASPYEVMNDKSNPRHTKFNQLIQKELQKSVVIYERINSDFYKYPIEKNLSWMIAEETTQINGYDCTKATTHFGGRNYEAWFTKEIPIADGPYVFCGLPGLIVKLNDANLHYTFELIGFETFRGEVIRSVAKEPQKIIITSREKVFEIREESRKDPIGSMDRSFGMRSVMTPEKQQLAKNKVAANNNPLELRVE